MKIIFDRHTKEDDCKVNDLVLKWDARNEDRGRHGKFDHLWMGPFKIVAYVGTGENPGFNSQERTNKALTTGPFSNTCEADEVSPEVEAGVVARLRCLQPYLGHRSVIISFTEHLALIIHQYSTLIILRRWHRASQCSLRSTVFQYLTIVTQIRSSRSALSILIHIRSNNHIYLRSTEHKWIYQST
jgi:hypothetical protein